MAKKDPTGNGSNRNSYGGSEKSRADFDREQAGTRVPYYPEFPALDSSFSVGINQRNYLGERDGSTPREHRDVIRNARGS